VATTSQPRSTTTSPAVTTTTTDRLSEVAAILEDLERRRLAAIYSGDVEAFGSLYANAAYQTLDEVSLSALEVLDPDALKVIDLTLLVDSGECLVLVAELDASTAFVGGTRTSSTVVLEKVDDMWGYSWIGEGWLCEGSHPLSQS
jgi:hypothetical protein